MKLLLVLGSDDNYDAVSRNSAPLGFEPIRYRHVLKAMDNIDEVDPAAIIISARDFPRHWKILVQFVRSERSKETCPIIILKGTNFNTEETSKALFLGVNGIFDDTLEDQDDIDRLREILGCPGGMADGMADGKAEPAHEENRYFFVEPWHRIGLLIANISGKSILIADVKTISANGLSFSPASPLPAQAVTLNKELRECSLRAGDALLSPVCRISGVEKNISLEFVSFPDDERRVFDRYLEEFQLQEA
ncbi:MAG: PilZ domain-containing protein [Treponema sp.]|jgi:hypothetical protein|nr:PilZ domain-containing protein [Treponema sp.]